MADLEKVKRNLEKMISLGAPREDIDEYLKIEGVEPGQVEGPGTLFSIGRGAKDVIDAGAQMLTQALPESVVNAGNVVGEAIGLTPMTAQDINKDITQSNAQYETQRAMAGESGIDWPRMGGQVAATLPLSRVIPAAATIPGAAAAGAGGGALFGAMTPITKPEEQENFWTNKLQDMAMSAGIAAPVSAVTGMVGKALSPKVDEAVNYFMKRGVTPTVGQIAGGTTAAIENKLRSVPLIGDAITGAQKRVAEQFNRAVLNEALKPIGGQVDDIGRAGIEQADDVISAAYQKLLPELTYQADDLFKADLTKIAQLAKEMPEPQFKAFLQIVKNKLASRLGESGSMDGQTFKGVESELTRLVKGYMKDPSFDQRQLGSALEAVRTALRDNLVRANPVKAPELQQINRAWANFARVRDAASKLTSEGGVFSPAQLLSAVKAGDSSAGKGQFAKGKALLQEIAEKGKQLFPTFPNSGTADRAIVGAAALGHVDIPTILATGMMAAPYTKLGQKAAGALMTKRPEILNTLGRGLMQAAPVAGAVGGGVLGR